MRYSFTIEGIESAATKTGNTRVNLISTFVDDVTKNEKKGKFHFFQLAKGKKSEAMLQFEKFNFKLGDTVSVESKDEEKTFTNPQGKEITYTEHWIQKFIETEGVPSHVPSETENTVERKNEAIPATCNCTEKWNNIRIWSKGVQKQLSELKRLETLLVELKGESAVKLHSSIKSPTMEEPEAPSLEAAAAIVDSYKSDPTIPTINISEVPEGFDKE